MPHALSIILGYLVCLSWHAYFKAKDHQIIEHPMELQSWTESGKMKQQTNPPTPPPKKTKKIMDETVKNGI